MKSLKDIAREWLEKNHYDGESVCAFASHLEATYELVEKERMARLKMPVVDLDTPSLPIKEEWEEVAKFPPNTTVKELLEKLAQPPVPRGPVKQEEWTNVPRECEHGFGKECQVCPTPLPAPKCEHPAGSVVLHAVCDTCGHCDIPTPMASYTPTPPAKAVEWAEGLPMSLITINRNLITIGRLLESMLHLMDEDKREGHR